ncbi:hypothetical protein ACWDXD_24830 [Streptomyces sp. NPDC003314]
MSTLFLPVALADLPVDALTQFHNAVGDELRNRNAADLPGVVREALDVVLLDVEVPRVAVVEFRTVDDDTAHSWFDCDVEVTFDDGSTRALDLSEHAPLGDALTAHAYWHAATLGTRSTLRVAPASAVAIYKS